MATTLFITAAMIFTWFVLGWRGVLLALTWSFTMWGMSAVEGYNLSLGSSAVLAVALGLVCWVSSKRKTRFCIHWSCLRAPAIRTSGDS